MGKASIEIEVNTDTLVKKLKAIAKHAEALANELESIDKGTDFKEKLTKRESAVEEILNNTIGKPNIYKYKPDKDITATFTDAKVEDETLPLDKNGDIDWIATIKPRNEG